jgi:3-hydroxyisobutyrate dehydrogenase
MGVPMASRVLGVGCPLTVYARTRAKAAALAAAGARIATQLDELRGLDVVFTMLGNAQDGHEVYFGEGGVASEMPSSQQLVIVDCSTIGASESEEFREKLARRTIAYLAVPFSGNPLCVICGKLSCIASGSAAAFHRVDPLRAIAPRGVTYAGEGERARMCKIAHNVFLGVVFEGLMEVVVLAERCGIPRHSFLEFLNKSVLGLIYTQYKSPALVNLDYATTFPRGGFRKDLDLGLDLGRALGVSMPATTASRQLLHARYGNASIHPGIWRRISPR